MILDSILFSTNKDTVTILSILGIVFTIKILIGYVWIKIYNRKARFIQSVPNRNDVLFKSKCLFTYKDYDPDEGAFFENRTMFLFVFEYGLFLLPLKKKYYKRDNEVYFFYNANPFPKEFKIVWDRKEIQKFYFSGNTLSHKSYSIIESKFINSNRLIISISIDSVNNFSEIAKKLSFISIVSAD